MGNNYNYNYSVNENYTLNDDNSLIIAMFSGGSSTTGAATFTCNVLDWDSYIENQKAVDEAFEQFKQKVLSDVYKLKEEV